MAGCSRTQSGSDPVQNQRAWLCATWCWPPLPEDQRDALALRQAGPATEDIAGLLGISADAAKKRVSRARKRRRCVSRC
ncbi:sigma factor-like helix-turn-helix DNA-binding protein [Amycolatopsis sp. cmx-4-61]|uniref:sigma factor-like helix-turn-helix DNA-binding protein n=1 Tax=Amycolatopsis sp. cmx-4-61 TaxID=2790937 RepID=UPI00397B3AC2